MDMKEKQPITPVTPVPTPSAAIEAEAHDKGPSPTQSKPVSESSDMKLKFVAALLAGSALTISAPAFAAAQDPAPAAQPEPTEPDQSDAQADAIINGAQGVDEAAAKIELLQSQVDALQASIEQLKGQLVKATPSWHWPAPSASTGPGSRSSSGC